MDARKRRTTHIPTCKVPVGDSCTPLRLTPCSGMDVKFPPPLVYPRTMITAHSITQFTLCPCALYLDLHGPQEGKSDPHPFLEYLQHIGVDHEAAIASRLPHIPVPDGPVLERAHNTHQLMLRGAERIYQPVLLAPPLLGIPDFLERTEIPSELGAHSYRPVDVKIASSPHPEHLLQLAFYGLLLEQIQGANPETGDLILMDGSRETIQLSDHVPQVEEAIAEVEAIRAGREEEPCLSTHCGMCPWEEHCLEILRAKQDLSLLNGLSRGRKGALNGAGYFDLSDIANASPDALSEVRGVGERTAQRMIMQASVLLQNEPRILSTPQFLRKEVELYLDMECSQGTQVIYLIGVLEVGRNGAERYRAFLAERPEDEGAMWAEFLDYLDAVPEEITIYHYHDFESTHLRKLAERHGLGERLRVKLFDNLIDLHAVLKQSAVLPVYSYGLKSVAKWMGFSWREKGSDAAMSMMWFDLWLNTGDRKYLELAVEYNEDDCRGTRKVKHWIEAVGVS
jgi:predicted RecB family nuclease